MEIQKFTGWVEKIFDATQYDREIAVANYKDESAKESMLDDFKNKKSKEYPIALKFKAGVKSGASAQLDGINEGDKVDVQFCISGKSGVSKKTGNYYVINELNICKKDGVTLLERAYLSNGNAQPSDDQPSDLPF